MMFGTPDVASTFSLSYSSVEVESWPSMPQFSYRSGWQTYILRSNSLRFVGLLAYNADADL